MPNYDYKCQGCATTTTIAHSITAKMIVHCPNCQKVMARVPSAPTVTFKGTGWGKDA